MRACRQSCIDEVQRKVAAGFTFDKVRELIQHPPKGVGLGEYLEGQRRMGPQLFAHLLMVFLIILGNVIFFAQRRRGGGS